MTSRSIARSPASPRAPRRRSRSSSSSTAARSSQHRHNHEQHIRSELGERSDRRVHRGRSPADLSVKKTADFTESTVGSSATYTIVVTNNGPGEATDVVVTDDLPAGTTFVSSSAGCSGTTTVTCAVGTLAAGDSATIEIVVTLPSTPGTVSNTASVASSSTDPAGGNDAATVAIEAH
ncbi:MAG: DUF11 domain-containing protein, partial [Thermoanaerobaculia bacterium]